jgi:hypothetical protein
MERPKKRKRVTPPTKQKGRTPPTHKPLPKRVRSNIPAVLPTIRSIEPSQVAYDYPAPQVSHEESSFLGDEGSRWSLFNIVARMAGGGGDLAMDLCIKWFNLRTNVVVPLFREWSTKFRYGGAEDGSGWLASTFPFWYRWFYEAIHTAEIRQTLQQQKLNALFGPFVRALGEGYAASIWLYCCTLVFAGEEDYSDEQVDVVKGPTRLGLVRDGENDPVFCTEGPFRGSWTWTLAEFRRQEGMLDYDELYSIPGGSYTKLFSVIVCDVINVERLLMANTAEQAQQQEEEKQLFGFVPVDLMRAYPYPRYSFVRYFVIGVGIEHKPVSPDLLWRLHGFLDASKTRAGLLSPADYLDMFTFILNNAPSMIRQHGKQLWWHRSYFMQVYMPFRLWVQDHRQTSPLYGQVLDQINERMRVLQTALGLTGI